jgi:trehalose-6-phosphate synthase
VAKEYAVANQGSGVIILSAFAGAAAEFGFEALLVDPSEPDSVAVAILSAFQMPMRERRARMARAGTTVRIQDVHGWVRDFLAEGMLAG